MQGSLLASNHDSSFHYPVITIKLLNDKANNSNKSKCMKYDEYDLKK
jgi:hypothetical protein